mgnify:CR=1 FL=1
MSVKDKEKATRKKEEMNKKQNEDNKIQINMKESIELLTNTSDSGNEGFYHEG